MTLPILSISNLFRAFGATQVLDRVSLDIAPGEFVILIGGSGSGKTTLLRTVAGLDHADAGTVALRGQIVDDATTRTFVPPERRGLGMVFQDYALWPHMTCLENVMASARGRDRDRRAMAQELLDQLHVGTHAQRRPAQLSGGQQQRVGLARALAAHPDLLLLDEPLSSLDVDIRERMRESIRTIVRQREAAVLLVSHDPMDAWRLGDRVAVLEQGRIVQAATPEALYRRPATARIARFTDAVGSLPVRALRRSGASLGFDWAQGVQEAVVPTAVGEGRAAKAYIRPCGVRAGADGEPARLVTQTFEAGAWRATWHVPAHDWTICSLEAAPPPPETRLSLRQDHVFLYPEED